MHEPEKLHMKCLLSPRVRPASSAWILQASKAVKSFNVLCTAGVGVTLFIFKLSSTDLPGTDALLGWGNPPEAHEENVGSGSFCTVLVLVVFPSLTPSDKDKEMHCFLKAELG